MIILPIVERELRRSAKRAVTYWLRALYAFGGTAVAAWLFFALADILSDAGMGQTIFRVSGWFLLYCCLFMGAIATSDSVSSEKRHGTLGLLFLTDLKGHDIILGKIAANSLESVYGLVAVLPVMALPLLLGGVTGGEFCRVAVALLIAINLALAVGIMVSTVSRNERKARGGALLLVAVLALGLPALDAWLVGGPAGSASWSPLCWVSPAYSCHYAFDLQYVRNSQVLPYWSALALQLGLAIGLTTWASYLVPAVWRGKMDVGSGSPSGRRGVPRWVSAAKSRRLLDINPILWLSSRPEHRRLYPWIFVGAMVCTWTMCQWQLHHILGTPTPDYTLIFIYLVQAFLKLWVAVVACLSVAPDRESGALELILCTPLSTREILRGHRQGLWRFFAGPIIAVLLCDLWLCWHHLDEARLLTSAHRWKLTTLFAAHAGMFAVDTLTLTSVGLWMSLRKRTAVGALAATLLRIMVPPGLAVLLLSLPTHRTSSQDILGIWVVAGLSADLLFGLRAWWGLRHQFRLRAL